MAVSVSAPSAFLGSRKAGRCAASGLMSREPREVRLLNGRASGERRAPRRSAPLSPPRAGILRAALRDPKQVPTARRPPWRRRRRRPPSLHYQSPLPRQRHGRQAAGSSSSPFIWVGGRLVTQTWEGSFAAESTPTSAIESSLSAFSSLLSINFFRELPESVDFAEIS